MRKIIISFLSMLFLSALLIPSFAQKKTAEKKMTWTTSSPAAKTLALHGANHLMNAETALAYEDLMAAVKLDPNFTVALALLSNITTGATRKAYIQRTLNSAKNKTAGEKLFASIVDPKLDEQKRRDNWDKLYKMFPDGEMISNFYVQSRPTAEERFTAATAYMKKFPKQANIYNTIAYYYLNDNKDNAKAKEYFEKYIAMYPEGYNPYDSMGEYYLLTGDLENSKKYYSMSLEKYPFNITSINALQKMADDEKKMK